MPVDPLRCAVPDTVGSQSVTMGDSSSRNLTARNLTEEIEYSDLSFLDYENLDIGMKSKVSSSLE